ncbi:MAG: TIGR03118 family protein [Actinomycetota bacterium]
MIRLGAAVALLAVFGVVAGIATVASRGEPSDAYVVRRLVSDEGRRAPRVDLRLRNAWGLAASQTGPWWTANEASSTSTLYAGSGRKQLLNVIVAGGPTGIVYQGGAGFRVASHGASDPARFIYACEDGRLRTWTPTVPTAWSTQAVVSVDASREAAVFRGLALADERLYATDFHNGRVDVFDRQWRRIRRAGAFVDRSIPQWYAPFGIQAIGDQIFVTYVWRAPVNGNDAPTGGYVDEFDRDGNLVAHVGRNGALNAPWGIALAPRTFGRYGGDLLVGNFGDGRVNAYRRSDGGWTVHGTLRDRHGEPLVVNGLWGIGFGNDAGAGPADTLFFTSGPHQWRGVTELGVHGVLGSISAR